MEKMKNIVRKMLPNMYLHIILDALALIVSSALAVWVRFDFGTIPELYFVNSYAYILIDLGIMFFVFWLFKLYRAVWTFASVTELLNIIEGCFILEVLLFAYKMGFNIAMPRSYYIIQLLLLITFTCFIRFGYRIFKTIHIKLTDKSQKINTMVIGAGNAGRLIIDEIYNNQKKFDMRIVCVIDDNKSLVNSYIKGIKIYGTTETIKEAAEKYEVQNIIIAIPSASKEEINRIVTECHKTKCKIKILSSIYKELDEKGSDLVSKIRPLSYEDFLGRDQIIVDSEEIKNSLNDKVILITGGGGSIGSELCRQIAKCHPKKMIIFDIYENNAYEIQQELQRNYPEMDLNTVIGSVRDYDRLENIFQEFHPDQVYHAAAHKHVPLMEVSPNEAIKNNALGTLNVCKLADKYEVKKFVLISSDKAVRPTNIMGASKRICEMIIQTYDKMSKNTDFVAVRFGNVLGSNGSVIPLFLKQIENGGPVTVTDKEIERYFMTIPEAVSLVLQAGCYAKGGEIFVLDMGKPVKIYDLAEKLIRYKGYEPNTDIPIVITGLRPGEKLYEELLMAEEGLKETPNQLIHICQPISISKTFLSDLDKLIELAFQNQDDIKEHVAKMVPTYQIDTERVGK